MTRRFAFVASVVSLAVAGVYPAVASAHLHPFVAAATCAPEETGAGNEALSFFTAPSVDAQ